MLISNTFLYWVVPSHRSHVIIVDEKIVTIRKQTSLQSAKSPVNICDLHGRWLGSGGVPFRSL